MEDINLNLIINRYQSKKNTNNQLKLNKSYNGMKCYINKRNTSEEICKNNETEETTNKSKENTKLSLELKIKNFIKENKSLQNELKTEKNKKQQDYKKINLLKQTINNLISENDKNIINALNSNLLNANNNNKTYADILISAENIFSENINLNNKLSEYSKIKDENLELKNKLIDKEQALNELISKNIFLEKKLEINENKISALYEKLKDFQKYEEMKFWNESLQKKLDNKNEENIELKKIIKEKEKMINELKEMKYDNKLFYYENELNEYKLKESKYINEMLKIKTELRNTKNKLEINSDLLQENQKIIKENKLNIEKYIIQYNDLKNEYNSLKNKNSEISVQNNELKEKNIIINQELNEFKINYNKYKKEIKDINNKLIQEKNEKETKEKYYLEQISIIQKEKNVIEKNYNEINEKYLFNKNMENIFNKSNDDKEINNKDKYDEKYFKKKYEIALNEIKNYNIDNKKLLDLIKKLKNDINLINEEKQFYINIINKLIKEKYIDSKYNNFINLIKNSIENYLDIQNLKQLKYDLQQRIIKYEKIIKNMNKKIDCEKIENSYEINKNCYDIDDFCEIAKIQNQLMNINDKLNILYENKIKIKKDFEQY